MWRYFVAIANLVWPHTRSFWSGFDINSQMLLARLAYAMTQLYREIQCILWNKIFLCYLSFMYVTLLSLFGFYWKLLVSKLLTMPSRKRFQVKYFKNWNVSILVVAENLQWFDNSPIAFSQLCSYCIAIYFCTLERACLEIHLIP